MLTLLAEEFVSEDFPETAKSGIMMGTPPILIDTAESPLGFFKHFTNFTRSEIVMIVVIIFILMLSVLSAQRTNTNCQ